MRKGLSTTAEEKKPISPMKGTFLMILILTVIVGGTYGGIFLSNWIHDMFSSNPYDLIGEPAPDFTYTDLQNQSFTLSDHQGEIVLIEFFMSRCHFCFKQTHILTDIQAQRPNLTIVSVSIDLEYDNRSVLEDYILNFSNASWTFVRDTNTVGYNQYHIQGVPTIVIIDENGIVISVLVGVKTTQELLIVLDSI